jgi:ABC-type transport system involved in multi-copper enzyme maturation permease subunit
MTPYRSTVAGGDGFGQLLLAEWTKLRSVPGWMLTLLAAVVLTVGISLLMAVGSGGGVDGRGDRRDAGRFEHRALSGDGSVVAHVAAQDGSQEWAKAGLMIRASDESGAPYAALMVTPGHGVRLQSDFTGDIAGGAAGAPRWLKLTRAGSEVTGYESADGAAWRRVGTVELDGLPRTAQAGPFVATPDAVDVGRQFGGETVDAVSTVTDATFEDVRAEPAVAPWPATVRLTGSGDIGRYEYADDVTELTLSGVLVGLAAIVALAVLFIGSEYERGTIRTTFAASPRRARVLAAKAVVIAGASLAAGLVASFGAFLLAGPVLRANGLATASLLDGPALRAVVGTAVLLAVVALLSLAVATIARRAAVAITAVLLALLVPQIVATGLPAAVAVWVERVTPAAGFAIQQTVHRYDTAIAPLAGLAVLCGYTALALAVATWRLRRSDA